MDNIVGDLEAGGLYRFGYRSTNWANTTLVNCDLFSTTGGRFMTIESGLSHLKNNIPSVERPIVGGEYFTMPFAISEGEYYVYCSATTNGQIEGTGVVSGQTVGGRSMGFNIKKGQINLPGE